MKFRIANCINYKLELTIFLLAFCWVGFNWLSIFPALYSWDIYFYLEEIFSNGGFPGALNRESYLYEWYVYVFSAISPRMTAATFFQIILFSIFVARISSVLQQIFKRKKIAIFVGVALVFSPANVFFTLMTERDTLFAIFGCFGVIELVKFSFLGKEENSTKLFLRAWIYFSLMTCFRKESFLILLALPIYFFYKSTQNQKKQIIISYFFIVSSFATYSLLANSQSIDKNYGYKYHYNLNAVRNSFLYILSRKIDDFSPKDIETISHFFDLNKLKEVDRMIFVGPAEFLGSSDEEKMKQLYKVVLKSFFRYPDLFFQARWISFKMNFVHPMYLAPQFVKVENPFDFAKDLTVSKNFNLMSEDLFAGRMSFLKDYFNGSFLKNNFLFWYSNPTIPIFLLITVLMFFPIIPKSSKLVCIIMLHTIVVFFLCPGASTKYYYFTYLSSFILIPLSIYELISWYRIKFLQAG